MRAELLKHLTHPTPRLARAPRWDFCEMQGRIVEIISGPRANGAATSAAMALILDAQRQAEVAAWITPTAATFFPPDAAAAGIDLRALVVVHVPHAQAAARAAEQLLRSGAIGITVLDIATDTHIPTPLQSRLLVLAQKHAATVLCLAQQSTFGSLVSLRAHVQQQWHDSSHVACNFTVSKDKRRGPWNAQEILDAPHSLR
jgi:recombination protein RecA